MDGSASRGQEPEEEVEAGGVDSSQSGRHSLDSQQLPVMFQETLVDRQKVGKDLDKEGTVPQSVLSLVNMSQGSETSASPLRSLSAGLVGLRSSFASSIEAVLSNLSEDIKKGFTTSKTNQGEIREVFGALEKKLDLLVLRTQALEEAVGEIRVEISDHKKEIELLKGNEQALQSKLERLENNSIRNNLRVLNVPEDAEGGNLKMFSSSLLKNALSLEESLEEIAGDIQRSHRDPFKKRPGSLKPRKILIHFQTYSLKEKIL
ncbi:hypothetical protein NDU88_003338 [Pleurodeles waltl]|uniref:Uncharacterized protein n=1 Tax=Pleurodeles waltl TaxID=8319 RepID=A0AAV7VD23_PLEWA|nr:hypothetical protein NDU88_003338 [Pleurodeles waltl]